MHFILLIKTERLNMILGEVGFNEGLVGSQLGLLICNRMNEFFF